MNKSVMKCCICNNENIGQFITINNKKYHLCCIEQLQQENKKLENNWNELKRWLYEEHYLYVPEIARNSIYQNVLEKMYEIEKESNSNEI